MGIADMRLGGFQAFKQRLRGLKFAQVPAKQGVDEARLRAASALFRQFDGLIDGSVIGDAIEAEDLIKTEPQHDLKRPLLCPGPGFAGDQPVQRGLPSHDAADQFMDEVAVGMRERVGAKRLFQHAFHKAAATRFALPQNAGCNFSWFLSAQHL